MSNGPPWKMGIPASPPELTEKEKIYEAIKRERLQAQRQKPSRETLRARAVEAACTQAVEALRHRARYDDVLEKIRHAMNEELCQQIHDS
jgi:hypothetical protein